MVSLLKMFSIIQEEDLGKIDSNHFNHIEDYIEKFKVISEENHGCKFK